MSVSEHQYHCMSVCGSAGSILGLQTLQRGHNGGHRMIRYSQAYKLFFIVRGRAHNPQHRFPTRTTLYCAFDRLPDRQSGAANDVYIPASLNACKQSNLDIGVATKWNTQIGGTKNPLALMRAFGDSERFSCSVHPFLTSDLLESSHRWYKRSNFSRVLVVRERPLEGLQYIGFRLLRQTKLCLINFDISNDDVT